MPDSAAIIGKIAVKVIPDTDNFKEQLKTQLESIEQKAEKDPVEIPVVLDDDGIESDAKELHEKVKRALKSISLKVDIKNQDSLQANIRTVQRELAKLDEKEIKVKLNRADLNKHLAKFKGDLEKVAHFNIEVDEDSADSVRKAIAAIDAQLALLKIEKIPVGLDEDSMEEAKRKYQEILGDMTEMAKLELRVDRKSYRSVQRAIDRIDDKLAELEEVELNVNLNETSLKDAKRKLQDKLGEMQEMATIDIRVDRNSLKSVERAVEQIDAELAKLSEQEISIKMSETDLRAYRAKLQEQLDFAAWSAEVKAEQALQESLQRSQLLINRVNGALNDIKWAPGIDDEKLAKAKREIEAALLKIEELDAKIRVEMDPIAKRKLEMEIAELQARVTGIKAKIHADLDKESAARTEAGLKVLGRARDVVFKPVLDNKAVRGVAGALDRISGWRAGRDFMDQLKDILFNLDLLLPKISGMALGIGGLGLTAVTASAQLALLSAALAEIASGLALALPGAIISLGVAVGVAFMALKDFSKVLPDVTAKYKGLQKVVSNTFWTRAEAPLRRMANELFPAIKRGLEGVATSMGLFFGKFSDSLRTILGPQLEGMFGQVARGLDNLTAHTDAFATIFTILGKVGSVFFADMMGELGKAADGWAAWLTEAEKTGKLKEMIDDAVKGVKNLWRAGKNLLGIFSGIADAAEKAFGSDILTKLANNLERIHGIVDSPAFQKELTEVFEGARKGMDEISNRAGPALEKAFKNLGDLAEDVFPTIGATIGELVGGISDAFNNPTLQSGLRGFFESMKDFAENARPAWDKIGEAIGAVLGLLSTFMDTAGPGVAKALENIAGWISTLATALQPLAAGLGTVLGDILDRIAPHIDKIVNAIASFAQGDGGKALVGFFEDLAPLIESIAAFLGRAAEELAKWANENLPKIREDLGPIIDDLKKFVDEHGDTVIAVLLGIGDAFVGIVDALSDLSPIMGELTAVGGLLLLTSRFVGLGKAIGGIAGALGKIPKGGIPVALGLAALGVFILADENDDGPLGWLGKLRETLKDIGDFINMDFGTGEKGGAWGWLDTAETKISEFIQGIQDLFSNAAGPLGLIHDLLFGGGESEKIAPPEIEGPKSNWGPEGPPWKAEIEENLNQIPPMFDKTYGDIQTATFNWNSNMNTEFQTGMGNIQNSTRTGVTPLPGILGGGLGGMMDTFLGWIPGFNGEWGGLWTDTGHSGQGFWGWIEGLFGGHQGNMDEKAKTGMGNVQRSTDGGWLSIIGSTGGFLGRLLEDITGGYNRLPEGAKPGQDRLVQDSRDLPGRVRSAIGTVNTLLYSTGSNLIQGLLDGWTSKLGTLFSLVTGTARDVKNKTNSELDIHSPSRVFMEIGRNTIDGFIVGMESRHDAVKKSLEGLSDEVGSTPFTVQQAGLGGRLRGLADGSMADSSINANVLNYYAAPGSSLSSEEDLFAAGNRARMGW